MRRAGEKKQRIVTLGRITGAHGVKGWVRVHSHCKPREAILQYRPWLIGADERRIEPLEGANHGKTVIARLDGVENREQADSLAGLEIGVERHRMPDPGRKQYYWADLVGLDVVLENGEPLGSIEEMMATGANDVMVVKGGRDLLIPFIMGRTVLEVDLESGRVTVDWDTEF